MDVIGWVLGGIGVVVGVLALWYAVWDSRRASKELRAEAARLRQLVSQLLWGFSNAGVITVTRGPDGEPSLVVPLSGIARAKLTASGTPEVVPPPPSNGP